MYFFTLLKNGQTFSKLIYHYFSRNWHTTKINLFTICLTSHPLHIKQWKIAHTCTNSIASILRVDIFLSTLQGNWIFVREFSALILLNTQSLTQIIVLYWEGKLVNIFKTINNSLILYLSHTLAGSILKIKLCQMPIFQFDFFLPHFSSVYILLIVINTLNFFNDVEQNI